MKNKAFITPEILIYLGIIVIAVIIIVIIILLIVICLVIRVFV